jgi:general secretion pathway protein B
VPKSVPPTAPATSGRNAAPPQARPPAGMQTPRRAEAPRTAQRPTADGAAAVRSSNAAPPAPAEAARPAPLTAPRQPVPTTAAAAAATAAPLPRLNELPEELRREVPALAFGGAVHSELPAQRMVILNGQLLREGESITNELAVDEIRAKSAVLRIRGRRFEFVY